MFQVIRCRGIFIQNVLHNAVREGVRFAITQQTGGSGQDAAIKSVVQTASDLREERQESKWITDSICKCNQLPLQMLSTTVNRRNEGLIPPLPADTKRRTGKQLFDRQGASDIRYLKRLLHKKSSDGF